MCLNGMHCQMRAMRSMSSLPSGAKNCRLGFRRRDCHLPLQILTNAPRRPKKPMLTKRSDPKASYGYGRCRLVFSWVLSFLRHCCGVQETQRGSLQVQARAGCWAWPWLSFVAFSDVLYFPPLHLTGTKPGSRRREIAALHWGLDRYTLALVIDSFGIAGMLAEGWRDILPPWLSVVIAVASPATFLLVKAIDIPDWVVALAHRAASIWFVAVSFGLLLVPVMNRQPLPGSWFAYAIFVAIGTVPCAMVFYRWTQGR